jgi:quercetin dioxygenase-like cupin family protein
MHRTETIDYGIVLEGEIHLVLDDSEVRLEAGDVVVQRGTDHAWENRSAATTRMAFILVDGVFSDELRAAIGPAELYDKPLDG